MNLLLFETLQPGQESLLVDQRQSTHILQVLKAKPGDPIRVGQIGGQSGSARLAKIDGTRCVLDQIKLNKPGGSLLPADLVIALPRPKMARRVLESAVQIGFRSIHLINSWKVEKSFWHSHYLEPDVLRQILIKGAEQAAVTCLPEVYQHRLFKPFVQDLLPELCRGKTALVGDAAASQPCPTGISGESLLAIGPEGGFTQYELDQLELAGLQRVSMGPRIFRVETALPLLSGRLYTSQSK